MTHFITTDADFEKAINLYCEENNIDKFTLKDFKSNRDLWIDHNNGIFEVRKRENLVLKIDDEQDIQMQLNELNISTIDVIKYLLTERLNLLDDIYILQIK